MVSKKYSGMSFRTLLLTAALLVSSFGSAAAASSPAKIDVQVVPLQIIVDGGVLQPSKEQNAFIYENSTYVPLRFAAYSLGRAVQWDSETATVLVQEPSGQDAAFIKEFKAKHTLPSTLPSAGAKPVTSKLNGHFAPVQYVFDNVAKQPQKPGFIYNGTLYVPLRFVAESIGFVLDWDQATYSIKAVTANKPKGTAGGGGNGSASQSAGSGTSTAQNPSDPALHPVQQIPTQQNPTQQTPPQQPTVSYSSIISSTNSSLETLEASCKNRLMSVYLKYLGAQTDSEREAVKNEGYSIINQCDTSFENLMTKLTNTLSVNGYDTHVVETYRAEYAAKKNAAFDQVVN